MLLKEYADPPGFQHSDGVQAINGVPSESGHRFCDDIVDFPGKAIVDHTLEVRPLVGSCTRDALIRIQVSKFPFFFCVDHLCIELHLVLIGCDLLIVVCRNSTVGGNSQLLVFCFVNDNRLLGFNY